MKKALRQFQKDPIFFLKDFALQALVLGIILSCLLLSGRRVDLVPEFELWHFILLPVALILGVKIPSTLHNAIHGNLSSSWKNKIFGELCGQFSLIGQTPLKISHGLHHCFPDSALDPHPPGDKGYFHFLATSQMNSIKVINRAFYVKHGKTNHTNRILVAQYFFYYLSIALRVAIIPMILPVEVIALFFVPAFLTNLLVFTHINYATHQDDEILNLNHNFYYRLVNLVGDGVYFHKNHHLQPDLVNPSEMLATVLRDSVDVESA